MSSIIDLEFQLSFYTQWRSFLASLRNECPVGSGHSASPASEQPPCCCLAVFTWAKQMVVSGYLCSYTPPVQRAPFFSWRLASDCGERCVTLMTPVAPQPTVGQKLNLKNTESVKSAGSRTSVIESAVCHTHTRTHAFLYVTSKGRILNYCNVKIFQIRQMLTFYSGEAEAGWYTSMLEPGRDLGVPMQTTVCLLLM